MSLLHFLQFCAVSDALRDLFGHGNDSHSSDPFAVEDPFAVDDPFAVEDPFAVDDPFPGSDPYDTDPSSGSDTYLDGSGADDDGFPY